MLAVAVEEAEVGEEGVPHQQVADQQNEDGEKGHNEGKGGWWQHIERAD